MSDLLPTRRGLSIKVKKPHIEKIGGKVKTTIRTSVNFVIQGDVFKDLPPKVARRILASALLHSSVIKSIDKRASRLIDGDPWVE